MCFWATNTVVLRGNVDNQCICRIENLPFITYNVGFVRRKCGRRRTGCAVLGMDAVLLILVKHLSLSPVAASSPVFTMTWRTCSMLFCLSVMRLPSAVWSSRLLVLPVVLLFLLRPTLFKACFPNVKSQRAGSHILACSKAEKNLFNW